MDKEPIWVIQEKRTNGEWEPIEFCYTRKAAREFCDEWKSHNECRIRKYVPEEK